MYSLREILKNHSIRDSVDNDSNTDIDDSVEGIMLS